jgi:2-dehydro-3-deoxy-D-arabinonate dehydratase
VRLVRFSAGAPALAGTARAGVLDDAGTIVTLPSGLAGLLAEPADRIREICTRALETDGLGTGALGTANSGQRVRLEEAALLAPVDGRTEVWAAGVTYERSRTARMAESADSADIYDKVYDAERPELFFKSAAWRVSGPGAPVSVRADSEINVPEPELAVVLNAAGEIVGWTICDDMSSRSIEGENPLYLPQAKIYLGGCAVGPWIRPAWEIADPYDLTMSLTILRGSTAGDSGNEHGDGAVVWEGTSSTSGLRRRAEELAAYLFREDEFPAGAILSTGTSLVPDLPFTLQPGDEIRISISGIGELANPVVRGKAAVTSSRHQA